MTRSSVVCLPVSLLVCAVMALSAHAATQNWGDFMGDTVMYLNVTEQNGEPNLLFSAPSVVGDTLQFDPFNFQSDVNPGPGASSTASELSTIIMAVPGYFISNVKISEAGDFTLIGLPGALAEAKVEALFNYTVLEIDGVAVPNGPTGTANMQFTTGSGPNGGEYSLPADAGIAVPWQGNLFLDIAAIMAASPFIGQNATKVELAFENILTTMADANASALIKKKIIGGLTIQTNIPEPSSVALAVLAGIPLAAIALRRRVPG